MIGQSLAQFQVTGKLGEGGMGVVYRADDTRLGRQVAIKVLPEAFVADEQRLQRFEREAKLLAALNHPNIAHIHGLEEDDGRRFLVMELADGEDLSERISRGALPVKQALSIARQIAVALEAAHEQGIVHRDLKPANVKVSAKGVVKVLDFGLAKAWDAHEASGSGPGQMTQSPTLTRYMTEAGMILGTAAYMSPEQARGKPIDARGDIWAFGVILMEMLTGRTVFDGETVTDVFASIVARDPSWGALPATTPPAIRRLLERCLQKDADQRLHSISDARIEIDEVLALASSSPDGFEALAGEPAAGSAKSSRAWKALAAALLLTSLLGPLAVWQLSRTEPVVVRASIPAPEGTVFDLNAANPGVVALSPDGSRMAFGTWNSDTSENLLWLRDLDDVEARPIAGVERNSYPFWSPDGKVVGFFTRDALKRVDADGGPVLTVTAAANGKGGTWNGDGVILFAPAHNTPIHRVDAAGGESTPITTLAEDETSHRFPWFLPDGDRYLYVARTAAVNAASDQDRILVGSLSGAEPIELFRAGSAAFYAGGHLLYVRERTLMARPFDPGSLELLGDAMPVAENVTYFDGASRGFYGVSDGGVLVYLSGTGRTAIENLAWIDRTGQQVEELTETLDLGEVALSPDARRAVLRIEDVESGNADLWVLDLERGLRTRLTFDPGIDQSPVWSPDGGRIVFSSDREAGQGLYVKDVAGRGDAELLLAGDSLRMKSWSSDGRWLVGFRINDSGTADVVAVAADGSETRDLVTSDSFWELNPVVSPDNRWMAYQSNESGRGEIYVVAFPEPGGKWQVSAAGGHHPLWSADGRQLYFVGADDRVMSAAVDGGGESFVIGEIEALFEGAPVSRGYDYQVTPDGERFLFIVPTDQLETPPMTLVLGWDAELARR